MSSTLLLGQCDSRDFDTYSRNRVRDPLKWPVAQDLHLHRSVISRIDEQGKLIESVRIDNDPKRLVAEVFKAGRKAPVAIEATYGWYWAVDALQAARFEVHLAHPYGMKKMRKRKRVKTDQADAYEPAAGAFRDVGQGLDPQSAGQARHPVAVSHLEGMAGSALLDLVDLPGFYAQRLDSQRRLLMLLENEVDRVEVELDRRLKNNTDYRNLLKIKGIGPTLAAVFVVEIGDVHRFTGPEQLTCWAGLTPRHYESDRTVRRGQISKEGCTLVRWAAVEAVQRPCEPAVAAVKDRILERRGRGARNIAKVAAGRRMLETPG